MTPPSPLWHRPPNVLKLDSDEVHVWRCNLDQPRPTVQSLLHALTADERTRADRYYFEKDRSHFIVSRGSLRAILSRYLCVQPHQLRFRYSSYGKPALVYEFGEDSIRFNMSHSNGVALFAATRTRELGIDIEWIRPDLAQQEIAERFFSSEEVRILRALPEEMRVEAFFNCWTRKEAYVKAKGEGLSMPLDRFEVSLVPGTPAALLKTGNDPLEAARWSLRELFPGDGFAAAIAVQGNGWELKCWRWQG